MQCCVPICENSARNSFTSKEINFYEFPNEENIRAAWFMALGRHQELSGLAVCEQHFNAQDFFTTKSGVRTLKTDALPLVVRTCAICLDTDSQLYSLSIYKLEHAYINLTGLSYDGNFSRALCASCAQRLISCSTLRDRSLMAHSLLMELVETDSLTIQNIKLKREKILQTPNLDEKIFQPNHYDTYIQENNEYDIMEDNALINNEDVNKNGRREALNVIDYQSKRGLMKDNALIENEVSKDERTKLANETHIEVKREHGLTEIEGIETLNAIDSRLKRYLMKAGPHNKDKVSHTDERTELANETHIEVKCELETEDEKMENLNAVDSQLKRCLMKNSAVTNNEFVDQNDRRETSNSIIHKNDNEVVDNDERIDLRNETHVEVKRELDLTEDESTETSNAIDVRLKFEEFGDAVIKEEVGDSFSNESEIDNSNEVNETAMMGTEYIDRNNLRNYANRMKCTDCYEEFEDGHIYDEHYVLCHTNEEGRVSKIEPPADISMNDQFIKITHTSRGNENTIESHTPQLAEVYPNRMKIPKHNPKITQIEPKESKIGIYNLNQTKSKINKFTDNILVQGKEKRNPKCDQTKRKILNKNLTNKNKTDNVDEKQSIHTDKTDSEDKDIETTSRINVNKKFVCNKCSYETNHENYLKCHLLLHSTNVNAKSVYKCNQCAYITSMEQNLATHLTVHSGIKPYSCEICEYRTAFKRNLVSHNRTHTGEKPYSCSKCSYRCSVKYYLISHMRIHTGDLPYSCNICDYKCNIQRKLTRHMRTHSGEKPYTCDICKIKCSQQSNLRAHMRTHTGEKPFSCSVCEYRSSKKCSLDRHMRVHTGEKPYSCTICSHKTTTQYNLTTHMRTHTGEKPFACSICDIRYCRLKHLAKHMKTHR